MRIGKLESIEDRENAETSDSLIQLIQSEKHKNLNKSEKWQNWWHYYKWYVLCSIILLGIAFDLAGNALGLWRPAPDFQIAYVGKSPLPEDTVTALEHAFAALGEDLDLDLDFNKDGKIIVQLNQYASSSPQLDRDAPYYNTASEISLIGDISDCDSFYFLLENPDSFQQEHQLLANPDGSCPDKADDSTIGKVLRWSDCPALSGLELGSYTTSLFGQHTTGDSQELLAEFYIGRRCFYTDTTADNAQQCSALWALLTDS